MQVKTSFWPLSEVGSTYFPSDRNHYSIVLRRQKWLQFDLTYLTSSLSEKEPDFLGIWVTFPPLPNIIHYMKETNNSKVKQNKTKQQIHYVVPRSLRKCLT